MHVPDEDLCDEYATLRVKVGEVVRFPDAPGIANWHDFSYTDFAHITKEAAIDDILVQDGVTGRRPLLVFQHPGAARLTTAHLARFEAGLARVLATHGEGSPETEAMQWFCWWTRWALANCKVPALGNR